MWEISLSGQVSAFLCSLILGAVLAVFYDILRAARDIGAYSFVAVFTGDLLFWIISAITVFIYLVGVTNGQVRGYVLFSAAVGFALCRITLSKALYYITLRVLRFLATALNRIFSRLLVIVLFCERPFKYLKRVIPRLAARLFAAPKKLLKSIYNMLYTVKDRKKSRYDADE